MPGAPGHTSSRGVLELDLGADKLAQIVRFARTAEVRLVDVGSRSVRRLSRVGVGEGGQSFVGVGFAGAHLGCALKASGLRGRPGRSPRASPLPADPQPPAGVYRAP